MTRPTPTICPLCEHSKPPDRRCCEDCCAALLACEVSEEQALQDIAIIARARTIKNWGNN